MRPTRILPLIALVVAVLAGPAAVHAHAGVGGSSGLCDGFSRGAEVTMLDNCFAGTAQLVGADVSVLDIENQGQLPHTFTATDGSFDLHLDPGEAGTVELRDAAVVPVYCTLHGTSRGQGMAGVVVQTGAEPDEAFATDIASLVPGAEVGAGQARPASSNGVDAVAVIALLVAVAAAALSAATAVHVSVTRRHAGEGR